MNERIRELYTSVVGNDKLNFDSHLAEKFAELIVKNCARYVKNTNCFTYASQADLCAERMKQHFGVEE